MARGKKGVAGRKQKATPRLTNAELTHIDARGQAPRVVQINDAAVDAAWQITKTLGEKQDDALYAQYWLPV